MLYGSLTQNKCTELCFAFDCISGEPFHLSVKWQVFVFDLRGCSVNRLSLDCMEVTFKHICFCFCQQFRMFEPLHLMGFVRKRIRNQLCMYNALSVVIFVAGCICFLQMESHEDRMAAQIALSE